MAFFKFRWPGQKGQEVKAKPARSSRAAPAESIETMRRRARHRLIGAAVLVLLGVVGFPLLFDSQPRPIPVDIPIEIPDRNRVAPLVAPSAQGGSAQEAAAAPASAAPAVAPARAPEAASAPAPAPATATATAAAPASTPARTAATPAFQPASAPSRKPEVAPPQPAQPRVAEPARPSATDEAERARALLEGRSVPAKSTAADEGRFIAQIGAYAEADKAREVRLKLERAGIKTYTQVVETADGKRIRVRVGPFQGRAEADKAAAKIKALNLPVSILQL
ncbi:MAG: SPOR domain-containing protein [Burkholderiaceae bacterium]|nr:SPOR domain-containing protein [Burkholderiaceae bacterium]